MFLNWEILYIFNTASQEASGDLGTRAWFPHLNNGLVPSSGCPLKMRPGASGCVASTTSYGHIPLALFQLVTCLAPLKYAKFVPDILLT